MAYIEKTHGDFSLFAVWGCKISTCCAYSIYGNVHIPGDTLNIFRRFRQSAISHPVAFSNMYERNRLSVFRYIYSLVGGSTYDAEDLTAETFMRAWKARHNFEGNVERAIGWLIDIARKLVIDNYRRNTVRKTSSLPPNLKADSTTEEEVLVIQQKQRLLDLLNELPTDQREILVLRYMLGWKVNQIAAHLRLSENNISVIIHRTLAVLREQMDVTVQGKPYETETRSR